jgi:hypothetical protein
MYEIHTETANVLRSCLHEVRAFIQPLQKKREDHNFRKKFHLSRHQIVQLLIMFETTSHPVS